MIQLKTSPAARRDIRSALRRSRQVFGSDAAIRYQNLIDQALQDLAANPERPGAKQRPDLGSGIWIYPIALSRRPARRGVRNVQNPRHSLLYRWRPEKQIVLISRMIHDHMEPERHTPDPTA